jgi:hypothetical protein
VVAGYRYQIGVPKKSVVRSALVIPGTLHTFITVYFYAVYIFNHLYQYTNTTIKYNWMERTATFVPRCYVGLELTWCNVAVCCAPVMSNDEPLSIEKVGYVNGAVFVISLANVDNWDQAVKQPIVQRAKKGPKPVDPFSTASLKAEFKGYGRWRVRTSCLSIRRSRDGHSDSSLLATCLLP